MKRLSIPRAILQVAVILSLLTFAWAAQTQTPNTPPNSLSQIHRIYLDTTAAKPDPNEMRKHLLNSLRNAHSLEVVTDPTRADAILKATSETWVKGYVSVNPRSPGSKFPVYGGFLSAQLVGKDGDALWSYLVTPSRYASGGIRQDLTDQLVKKLMEALSEAAPAAPVGGSAKGVTLKAAGATFPAPLYQAWIESFREHHPGIHITYSGIGSEAGIQQLHDGKITFAASDVPLSDAYMTQMPVKLLQLATVIGAVVPIYHLPQAGQDLQFTPDVLAGIFLGKIRKWNDPAIHAINRSINLPDADIVVIHRADGSGTTFAFTDFLAKTSSAWKAAIGSGTTVKWPIGRAAQGNDGVASLVEQTPNSIGYAELSFAIQRQLSYGTVRNAAGNFTQANLITLAAAAASVSTRGSDILAPLTNAPGKDAYPITSFTWLLIPESFPDPATKAAVAEFLEWILTSGQKDCSALAYNPLPKEIVTRELEQLAAFKAK
ncbi:MAG: phosphate ABC transporter substrate-binding protein PstS [Edaphobacter sp.]